MRARILVLNCTATVALLQCIAAYAEEPAYVGSLACAGCHGAIYRSYARTAMGRSMQRPAEIALPVPAELNQPSIQRRFRVYRDGSDLYQSEYALNGSEKIFDDLHKLEYAIGSGVNGYSFVVRRGNYLFQAPLSYYSKTRKWELSPGYETGDLGFSRVVAASCITCHSGRPQPVPDRDGLYRDPPILELAITCENCHGPGSSHVEQAGKASAIVNPARLGPRLAEEICIMCHQGGDARVLQPGKNFSDFRPSMWSNQVLAIFKLSPAEGDLLEHHAAMNLSRCYSASGGRLGCLTCHDPHSEPAKTEITTYYRAKCLSCHTDRSCGLPPAARNGDAANDCITCHMPKRDLAQVSHSALTDHRIMSKPRPAIAPQSSDLIHVNAPPGGSALPALTWLRAYGQLAARRPDFEPRYLAALDELSRTDPNDPLVLAALGKRAMADRDPQGDIRARKYLEQSIAQGSTAPSTYHDLAEVLARNGHPQQAIVVLEKGLDFAPYARELYRALAQNYRALGRQGRMRKTLDRYLELFPQDDAARSLLRSRP